MRDHAEELKMLQEQLDRDNVNEINFMIKEAGEKAARENLEANVKTMYKNGADTKMISKLLGIPIEEIEEILNK